MNISANTVTIVIAICAILSPILVAVINNIYQLKIRKLDAADAWKKDFDAYLKSAFENYFKDTSRCIANPTPDNLTSYGQSYSICFCYFPPAGHDQLLEINKAIRANDWESANAKLESFSVWMSGLMRQILAM